MKQKKRPAVKLPRELIQLEQTVGQFMQYWGFKQIHGRIWVHLYTSQKPLDSLELMERLGVSKGLMSLAIRDLLQYQVINSDHVGKFGTTFFTANPDLLTVITQVLRERELKMLAVTEKQCVELSKLNPSALEKAEIDPNRVESILKLTQSAQSLLSLFLAQEGAPDGAIFSTLVPNSLHS